MPAPYAAPYTITSAALSAVAEIAGLLGRLEALEVAGKVPVLRRENRIRSIHSSLAIENNTLTLEQVTAFIEFLLAAILTALREAGDPHPGEQVGAAVSEQVAKILKACSGSPQSKARLLEAAGLANAYLNYKRHIQPLVADGSLEMTLPEKPTSRLQKYRLTAKG